jgi:hypothetical protein
MGLQLFERFRQQQAARARMEQLRLLDHNCVQTMLDEAQALTGSELDLARWYLEVALQEARAASNHSCTAKALARLAWLSFLRRDLTTAYLQAHEARLVAGYSADWTLDASGQFVLASIQSHIGNFDAAEASIHELITLAQTHCDQAREADYFTELGLTRFLRGHLRTAVGAFEYACNAYQKLNDSQLSSALNNLAQIHLELGHFQQAAELAERAHTCALPTMLIHRMNAMDTYALARIKLGDFAGARRANKLVDRYLHEIGNIEDARMWVDLTRAELAIAEGKASQAMRSMTALYGVAASASHKFNVRLLTTLKKTAEDMGDAKLAAKWAAELLRYNHAAQARSLSARDALARNAYRVNELAAHWAQVSQSRAVLIPL